MRESQRIRLVQSPIIRILADLIRQTPGTISLGQGVVAYGPPPGALAALSAFPAGPADHRYGPVHGSPAFLDAIEEKLAAENGISVGGSRRVVVTAGGNMAFVNAVLAVTDPGDEVVLQSPFYFNHDMAIVMAGCRTVAVPTGRDYQPSLAAIEAAITPRTKAVVTISPNNPTGAVYPEALLREVNELCRKHGVYHVHDEAYEYFTYGEARHFSPGRIETGHEHTISLFSLSKTYGMASWRIGYMLIPARLFEPVSKIQDTNLICPPLVSQAVGCAALRGGADYCRQRVRGLEDVRALVLDAFAAAGDVCEVPRPDGAFYCLVQLDTAVSSLECARRLILEHRVATVPGSAFGREDGCSLRVSYGALDCETVAEGMKRLVEGIKAIARQVRC